MAIKFEFDKVEKVSPQASEPSRMDIIIDHLSSLSLADIKAIKDESQVMMGDAMDSMAGSQDEYEKWEEIYSIVEDHLHFRIEQIFE